MLDLFKELLPSILDNKKTIITNENESEYVPYVVNKALGNHIDCVLYANEMNFYPKLDKKLQYNYYLHEIRPKKRPYQKWFKYSESDDILLVKEYFGYSTEKAKDSLKLLTKEHLLYIKGKLDKGGVKK